MGAFLEPSVRSHRRLFYWDAPTLRALRPVPVAPTITGRTVWRSRASAAMRRIAGYLSVSRKAAILVASSSVKPTLGIAVPGFKAGGFKIQALRSSGPVFGTAPPAILGRLATPARFGPT